MNTERDLPPTLLRAFALRAAVLGPEAWNRIGARCARLDSPTIEGALARAELSATALAGDADPYGDPLAAPTVSAVGRVLGVIDEIRLRIASPDSSSLEKMAADAARPESPRLGTGFALLMRLESLAQHQQSVHPGAAAALRAVGLALASHRGAVPASLRALYQPFEPEIPFDSLQNDGEQSSVPE